MMDRDLRLSAYVDGELDAEQAREVERQLASDPQARETVRIHRETTELLRAACAPSFYPERGQRFRDLLQRRRPHWPSIPTMALAASLLAGVLGVATGVVIGRGLLTETASLLEEIATYHQVFARETEHLVEVPAARRADLSAWLGERLGGKLTIPELSGSGLTFAGGRMLVVDGKPVAQLMYTRPGSLPLAVCITRSSKAPAPVRIEQRNGLDLAWWRDAAYTYVIIGVVAPEEAKILADRVGNALRS
jgi:anti-sigma factor RsiW